MVSPEWTARQEVKKSFQFNVKNGTVKVYFSLNPNWSAAACLRNRCMFEILTLSLAGSLKVFYSFGTNCNS